MLVWDDDFEAAKARAAKEKKDVFVYFSGSDWCGWCLLVKRDVLDKDAFADYAARLTTNITQPYSVVVRP